jgi:uncharacterized protein (UPF0332 family)
MSLHADLLRHARHLANLERHRPRQASLRRAVSAAYYSMFHLLVDESTRMMFGRGGGRRRFRDVLARGYSHQSMAATCRSFAGGNLPAAIEFVVAPMPIPNDLRQVADVFLQLQDARHEADYNRALPFYKAEVVNMLQDTADAFEAWQRIRNDEAARFFLMALPLWEQIRR